MSSRLPPRLRTRSVSTGCVATALAGLSIAACLSSTPAVAQRRDADAVQRGVTVTTRSRPEFDPLGVRLGSFRLDASAETGLGFDDNLFGTERDRRSSLVFANGGAASVQSQWGIHAAALSARIENLTYANESRLNTTDWSLAGLGRYDIDSSSSVELQLSQRHSFLSVQTLDLQRAGFREPLPFDEQTARLIARSRINRLSGTAYGQVRHVSFDGGESAALVDNTVAIDYFAYSAGTTIAYELTPGRSATLALRAEELDGEGRRGGRIDSFTFDVLAGFAYDFDGVYQASIGVGYARREYRDSTRRSIEGVGLDARLVYLPSQLTTITAAVRRGVDDSVRSGGEGFLRTLGSLRVDHELQRNIILGAEVSLERREYSNPSQRASDAVGVLSARWLINRNLSMIATYQHVTRFGTTAGIEEYDQNLVFLRLRISL